MTNSDYSPQAFVVAPGADAHSPSFALKQQLAELDTNAVYTLDVIDARNNAWGWFNFDSARIPGVLVYQGPALALQPWPDGSLRLPWPLSATDYRLEVSFDLENWEDAAWWGFFPAAEGDQTVVYVTLWEAALFFRLMKP